MALQHMEITVDELRHLFTERARQGETMILNMGPQHPSTHGVLRLMLELDGEVVVNCVPDIGFLHTGVEKNMEAKNYIKAAVMVDRLDYLNTMGNNLVYALAVEKLVGIQDQIPERAQVIRTILVELQRIASHLVWLGTHALDLAAMSVFLYCFREREMILEIFELVSGQRMMTTYIRPGGLWRDVPEDFYDAVKQFIDYFPRRIDQYEALLTDNPLFKQRTVGIGVLKKEDAIRWGATGPVLRGSGIKYDIRKARPYLIYDALDFDIPVREEGDVYARYLVRMEEMRQSVKIVRQALEWLKKTEGQPVRTQNRKFVPPPKSELAHSMEAVIHHFKYWTEGFKAPKGAVYVAVESPRGELGVYLEGNGGPKPQRVHFRTPSFANLQLLPLLAKGHMVADLVAIIGSIDIVLGDVDR